MTTRPPAATPPIIGAPGPPPSPRWPFDRDCTATGEAVGDALGEALGNAVGGVVGGALGDALGDALDNALGEAVGEAVGVALGDTVGTSLGDALGDVTGDVLGKALGGAVGESADVSTSPASWSFWSGACVTIEPHPATTTTSSWALPAPTTRRLPITTQHATWL